MAKRGAEYYEKLEKEATRYYYGWYVIHIF